MSDPNRIRAVVLDWAGTMIDFGSLAPAKVFQILFGNDGVEVTIQQVRKPMGMAKREHIAALLQIPEVKSNWRAKFGCDPAEVVLCAEDAPAGRPAPWLIFECAKRLNVFPMTSIVKVDDTIVGVQAGLNAGVWSVGVAGTGNLVGVSEEELTQMDDDQSQRLISAARETLRQAGAHFVIDSIAELPIIIGKIDRLLESRAHTSYLPFLDVTG